MYFTNHYLREGRIFGAEQEAPCRDHTLKSIHLANNVEITDGTSGRTFLERSNGLANGQEGIQAQMVAVHVLRDAITELDWISLQWLGAI